MSRGACFTVITATTPDRIGKIYSLDAKRRLKKSAVASIAAGQATTIEATPENLIAALKRTTESENQVIALDSFLGATPGAPAVIGIVTEAELERRIGGRIPSAPDTSFYTVNNKPVAARLKRLMQNSGWILIDADTPEGMPAQWTRLSLIERLKLLEAILPGISTCLRIEYRGSSVRVVNGSGRQEPGATHALIQISDPAMLDSLRLHVHVQSVLHDLSFKSPRYSRLEPGKVVGHADLTLIDLAVWVLGRLIFNARPDVSKALGYRVLGADPRIVNPKGGVLDISWIKPPSADQASAYRLKTGRALNFDTGARGGFAVREDGQLRLDTEIESAGVVRSLYEWLVEMLDGDIVKLRCEAPFRASESEAALIRITERGDILVFDSGTSVSSYLAPLPQTVEEARATAAGIDEYEMMEAVIAARERRTQRQAEAAFPDPPEDPDDYPDDEPENPLEPGRRNLLVAAWLDRDIPPRDHLLGHIICTTSRWLMFGETGVGKTLLTVDMAAAIASGSPMLGWAGQRATRVMYLDGELPAETFKERMQLIAARYGRDISLYGYNRDDLGDGQMPPLNEPKGEKWLMREIEEVKPELIVFDSIMALMNGVMGEEESWAPVKHLVRKLTARRIAQIWLHHTGHDVSKGFGTKTREWEMDTVAKLNFADERHEAFTMDFTKARLRTPANAHEFKSQTISLEPDGWISEPARGRPGTGRGAEDAARIRRATVDAYERLSAASAETLDENGKPVRKVETDKLRNEVKSRGWLDTKETGGLTGAARMAFLRVKSELLAGGRYLEKDGWFWAVDAFSATTED